MQHHGFRAAGVPLAGSGAMPEIGVFGPYVSQT